jgi:hypothetical protein
MPTRKKVAPKTQPMKTRAASRTRKTSCDRSDVIFAGTLEKSMVELVEGTRHSDELTVREHELIKKLRKNIKNLHDRLNALQLQRQLDEVRAERMATEWKTTMETMRVKKQLENRPSSYLGKVLSCIARETSFQLAKAAIALYIPDILFARLPKIVLDGSVVAMVGGLLKTPHAIMNPMRVNKDPFT